MPIHINEIVFKATVQEEKNGKTGSASGGKAMDDKDKQQLIDACVDQIMQSIRRKNER